MNYGTTTRNADNKSPTGASNYSQNYIATVTAIPISIATISWRRTIIFMS